MSKILIAVAAHADDVELNAGGTVAKWAAQGGEVHILMVTNNCSGTIIPPNGDEKSARRINPKETMKIRRREQEAAAAIIGAKVHYLGLCQRHYWDEKQNRAVSLHFGGEAPAPEGIAGYPPLLVNYYNPEHVNRLADLLVGLKPQVVLTQPVIDLDPEHHAVACLVWQAFNQRRQELGGAALRFWSPGSSCIDGLFDPGYDHIEDISDFYEKKLELCRAHASQMTQIRWDMVEKRGRQFGEQIGVRHGEPFKTAHLEFKPLSGRAPQ